MFPPSDTRGPRKWFSRNPRTADALPRGHRTALRPNFEYCLVQAYRPPESIVIRPSVGPRRRRISTSPTPRIFEHNRSVTATFENGESVSFADRGMVPGSRTAEHLSHIFSTSHWTRTAISTIAKHGCVLSRVLRRETESGSPGTACGPGRGYSRPGVRRRHGNPRASPRVLPG